MKQPPRAILFDGQKRHPVWAKCVGCGWIWPVHYTPIGIHIAAKLMGRCACPMCGNARKNVPAKQDSGRLNEPMPGAVA